MGLRGKRHNNTLRNKRHWFRKCALQEWNKDITKEKALRNKGRKGERTIQETKRAKKSKNKNM
jgi:hypothetical protein